MKLKQFFIFHKNSFNKIVDAGATYNMHGPNITGDTINTVMEIICRGSIFQPINVNFMGVQRNTVANIFND